MRPGRPGEPALEPGCGAGDPILDLLCRGLVVEGLDSSVDMLDRCRSAAAARGMDAVLHHEEERWSRSVDRRVHRPYDPHVPVVDSLPYAPWRERGSVIDGEFRWRLGIRPLDLADWIEFGTDSDGPDGWLADKARILGDHHGTAFAALDDIEPEATEVADAIVAHLTAHAPHRLRRIDASLHPLEAASRLVPEDLVMMVERNGRLVFGGGSVCFPNRWDLRSKLGRTMAEVHAPVAGLNEQLETNIDQFLARLRTDRPFWRLGWGIIDVADGYTPTDGTGPARPTDPDPSAMFVRVERETLRRFPDTNCVLFTIRTHVAPLAPVIADADSARPLAESLAAMSPGVLAYKDLVPHAAALADLFRR